jgi:hypothetical protein
MLETLRNKYQGSVVAILGGGFTILNYTGKEDICIAMNNAIQLDAKIDYFTAFDCKIPTLDYFLYKPKITRLLGGNIAGQCPYTFPKLEDSKRKIVKVRELDEKNCLVIKEKPNLPNDFWLYKTRETPMLSPNMKSLSVCGTILAPALELAFIMGAKEIHIYGCGLGYPSYWFDKPPAEGEKRIIRRLYCDKSAIYVNKLIHTLELQRIKVYHSIQEGSKIVAREL